MDAEEEEYAITVDAWGRLCVLCPQERFEAIRNILREELKGFPDLAIESFTTIELQEFSEKSERIRKTDEMGKTALSRGCAVAIIIILLLAIAGIAAIIRLIRGH